MLYLHVGDPTSAVRFDATPEGHHTRYGEGGNLVGVAIVKPGGCSSRTARSR